jgi:hypothetical protein
VLGRKDALGLREIRLAQEEGKRKKAYDGWAAIRSWARIEDKDNGLQKNPFWFFLKDLSSKTKGFKYFQTKFELESN